MTRSQKYKLIKIRSSLYFRLLELKEARRSRCTFNRLISELLESYLSQKSSESRAE